MRLVLMGPPGAGKGTQGELLARRFGVPRYSTGDILRAARRDGTPLGKEAQRFMDAGELVPDDVILAMVREELASDAARGGFLLDGFPRTVAQAEGLAGMLDGLESSLDAVANLEVADEEIVRRLSSRRVCGGCGMVTAVGSEDTDACDECDGDFRRRPDDEPETVRRRLEVYRSETEPVLRWYDVSETPVARVDGIGDVEAIQQRLIEAIGA